MLYINKCNKNIIPKPQIKTDPNTNTNTKAKEKYNQHQQPIYIYIRNPIQTDKTNPDIDNSSNRG